MQGGLGPRFYPLPTPMIRSHCQRGIYGYSIPNRTKLEKVAVNWFFEKRRQNTLPKLTAIVIKAFTIVAAIEFWYGNEQNGTKFYFCWFRIRFASKHFAPRPQIIEISKSDSAKTQQISEFCSNTCACCLTVLLNVVPNCITYLLFQKNPLHSWNNQLQVDHHKQIYLLVQLQLNHWQLGDSMLSM